MLIRLLVHLVFFEFLIAFFQFQELLIAIEGQVELPLLHFLSFHLIQQAFTIAILTLPILPIIAGILAHAFDEFTTLNMLLIRLALIIACLASPIILRVAIIKAAIIDTILLVIIVNN